MHRGTWVYAILLLFAAIPESWSQAKEETTIRELVQRASQAGDRQIWGRLIIQADAEAAKLERRAIEILSKIHQGEKGIQDTRLQFIAEVQTAGSCAR